MGTSHGFRDTITHEEHDVPAGLRGNVLFEDELHTSGTDIAITSGGTTFDITIDNPPIRVDTRSLTITDEPTGVDLFVEQVVDATTGVVRIVYSPTSTSPLSSDDEFALTYRGSDGFSFTVDFAPIQASGITEFVVPSEKDEPLLAFGDVFTLISTDNATGEVRIGVTVGSGDDDDVEGQGQADLPGHITVLGASYAGSETVEVPASGVAVGDSFTAIVEFPTEDADASGTNDAADVQVITGPTIGNATVIAVDGSSITFVSDGAASLVAGDTFTIAYAFSAGADPRNALLPHEAERPIILVGPGSRATIASRTDLIRVDAEADPPLFANPSPFDGSSTSDPSQTISIDITDALAGVNPDSVVFVFSDDSGDPATELVDANRFGDDDETVSISIEGDVVTASVDLDDVDEALTSLFIPADGTTTVWWWVEASDNAGNRGTSDAVPDDDADPDTHGNQAFLLRFDPEAAALDSGYTGDHWNPDTERIEGDRRIGVGQFLPGRPYHRPSGVQRGHGRQQLRHRRLRSRRPAAKSSPVVRRRRLRHRPERAQQRVPCGGPSGG